MIPAVELVGIEKHFGAVRANHRVDLCVARGSIHGVVGENGAGKSTLMSILYGAFAPTAGTIRINGEETRLQSPADAIAYGIGMVHQHFMLIDTLSVLENILLGAEGGPLLARGKNALRTKLAEFGRAYGLTVDPDAMAGDLGVGQRQRVEILKALVRGANVLILDEPTAVLTPDEADGLFVMLRKLRDEGKTILLVTHKLREIMAVTDHVSVMRRGEMVAHFDTRDATPERLADAMVGRSVLLKVHKTPANPGRTILDVRNLAVGGAQNSTCVRDVSFQLRAGEIVGIAGVAGNGQSELLEALAGMRPAVSGTLALDGATVNPFRIGPRAMRAAGLMHVPEDRRHHGLIMEFDACDSAMLGFHQEARYGSPLFNPNAIECDLAIRMDAYDIRPRDPRLTTRDFSGGNQQKIVLAREIERAPKVLLIGQPTRGVDIGAIEFIHKRLIDLRDAGAAILLVSVELDEILALSDRILVMCDGRVVGERPANDASDIGLLMAGLDRRAA